MSSLDKVSLAAAGTAPALATKWLSRAALQPGARMRLFCFPYAGGDSLSIFRTWPRALPPAVNVCQVQMPGRGVRISEPPLTRLSSIVRAAHDGLRSYFDRPFAFFGHSMGAMISFELARLLRDESGIEPLGIFVSGRAAPQIPDEDPPTWNLPDAEFLEALKRINGTPAEALEHPELVELVLPTLKADFQVCQTHTHVEGSPLNCPIIVLGGVNDDPTREELEAWKTQTRGRCTVHLLPGDHFFIRTEQKAVLRILSAYLSEFVSKLGT